MSWANRLQRASWRGVPFGVVVVGGRFGRRQAVHTYPWRDTIWVEDLGRAGRRITLVGFLVENSLVYGGGDVLQQQERMIAAAESAGPGTLIHPTLGELTVSLAEPLEITTSRDQGLSFELRFVFLEAGKRVFPSAAASTQDQTNNAAATVDTAVVGDFEAAFG